MSLRSLRQEHRVLIALTLLGLAGAFIIFYGTRWGPWAYSDAVGYMVNARNLATGRGFGLYRPSGQFIPFVSHPPLYSLLLIAVAGPGLDLVTAARWIDIFSFGILIFSAGFLLFRLTRSTWASLSLAAILLVHPALINAYTSAMAEPLSVLAETAGCLLLLFYLENPRPSLLVLSAVVCGMGFLTRYPGIVFVATGALCLVIFGSGTIKRRLKQSGIYTAIAVAPVAAFVTWSNIRYGGATPRGIKATFDLLPQFVDFLRKIPLIVYSWKPLTAEMVRIPGVDPDLLRGLAKQVSVGAVVALVVFVIISVRRIRAAIEAGDLESSTLRIPALFLILQAGYLAFFGVAYVVTSPTPDVDGRTILPILPALLVTLVSAGYILIRAWPKALWIRAFAAMCVAGSVAGFAHIAADPLEQLHQNGSGYTSPMWRKSPTIQAAMHLPPGIPLISNEPIAVLFYVGRWPHEMQVGGEPGLASSFTRYGDGAGDMESIFRDQHAALILFNTIYTQVAGEFHEETQARIEALTKGLRLDFQGSDGAIYFYP
jgi:4-amino-4-deoxy-L-arabinose transferase-like glycosyltransferase